MKISIVTPNYNYEKFIGETIESVVTQNYRNIEHIIIDDGSTDNSVEVIKKYQRKYPNKIKFIQQENKGQTAAINVGLSAATGDVIGWINSDDTFCANTLKTVMDVFENQSNIEIVFGDVNIVDINGRFIFRKRHLKYNRYESCFAGFANTFTSNAFFWRRELHKKNGYFNDTLKCNMDGDFFSRITRNSIVYHIKKPLANCRKQPFTIASLAHKDWDDVVQNEINKELQASYERLSFSKIIPYEKAKALHYFFRAKRILKRLILLHYFYAWYEKKK